MFRLESPVAQTVDATAIYLLVGLVLVAGVLILLVKFVKIPPFWKKRVAIDAIDLSNTKEAAYLLSEYVELHAKTNPHAQKLLEALKAYKYKKEVAPFDAKTLQLIKQFKEAL